MVRVKICGITRRKDAEAAVALKADLVGVNFYPGSPRFVEPERARDLVSGLPAGKVGVFVNPDFSAVEKAVAVSGVNYVQLHGEEELSFLEKIKWPVIKALRLRSEEDLAGIEDWPVWAVLVDSYTPEYGGSGVKPDWGLAAEAARRVPRLILAGGLRPENVREAVATVRPWGVDVASGVESAPGIKDEEKMRRFIEAVKDVAG